MSTPANPDPIEDPDSERPPTRPVASHPTFRAVDGWAGELMHKLWVSKGARFRANKRCLLQARWSQHAITLLTSYLIILGLLPHLLPDFSQRFPSAVLTAISVAVSILLLAYGLIESGKDYKLKAYCYHQCALAIARLYNRARIASELSDSAAKEVEVRLLSQEYERVLELYDNHDPIDYATFRTYYPDDFRENVLKRALTWAEFYFRTVFLFQVFSFAPLLFAYLAYSK